MNTYKNRQKIWAAVPVVRSSCSTGKWNLPHTGKSVRVKSLTSDIKQLANEKAAALVRAANPDTSETPQRPLARPSVLTDKATSSF